MVKYYLRVWLQQHGIWTTKRLPVEEKKCDHTINFWLFWSKTNIWCLPSLSNACLSSNKRVQLIMNKIILLTTTVNLLGAKICVAGLGQASQMWPCNGTEHIRHQCRKTTVLSCCISLINTGVEKMNYI